MLPIDLDKAKYWQERQRVQSSYARLWMEQSQGHPAGNPFAKLYQKLAAQSHAMAVFYMTQQSTEE